MRLKTKLNRTFERDGITIHYRAVADSAELLEEAPEFVGAIMPGDEDPHAPNNARAPEKPIQLEDIKRGQSIMSFARSRITAIDGVVDEDDAPIVWDELDSKTQRYVFAQLGEIASEYMTAFAGTVMPTRAEVSE